MPVVFRTPTSQRVIMLDQHAAMILKAIHTSGNIPGALYPDAIPAAIEALEDRIKLESQNDEASAQSEDSDEVDFHTRSTPLIELMQSAVEKNETLMWDKDNERFDIIK